jgi:hypothetical protein
MKSLERACLVRKHGGVPITEADLAVFARDGYLVLRGVVPEALLVYVDAEVDRLLDEEPPNEGNGGPGQNAWFMPRRRLPRCEDALHRSDATSIAAELVAPNALDFAFDHVQVAITVPPWTHIPGGPHIDGHGPGQDPPASFTMLAGILLTDQSEPGMGNLWVWPGSHLVHSVLFRERGTHVLQRTGGHGTLLDPAVEYGTPTAVLGHRGDLVLAHFLLGHNKGGNVAQAIRRTLYYRLAVPGHPTRWADTFLDPWTEYPPLQSLSERRHL